MNQVKVAGACSANVRRKKTNTGYYFDHLTLDDAIDRVRQSEFGYLDVAYFLQIPWYFVSDRWQKTGGREGKKGWHTIGHGRQLTYRLASQIYEALDRGLSDREVQRELNIKYAVQRYAVKNRPVLESKIKEVLQLLYPDKQIDKPYV